MVTLSKENPVISVHLDVRPPCGCVATPHDTHHNNYVIPARLNPDGFWEPLDDCVSVNIVTGVSEIIDMKLSLRNGTISHSSVDGIKLFCIHGEIKLE